MMSKKWFIWIGSVGLILGIALTMLAQPSGSVAVSSEQPIPVRAPAPSYAPAKATPSFTINSAAQPQPVPQPAPRPATHTVASQQPAANNALSGLFFIVTVLLLLGIVIVGYGNRNGRFHPQPALAEGI